MCGSIMAGSMQLLKPGAVSRMVGERVAREKLPHLLQLK